MTSSERRIELSATAQEEGFKTKTGRVDHGRGELGVGDG